MIRLLIKKGLLRTFIFLLPLVTLINVKQEYKDSILEIGEYKVDLNNMPFGYDVTNETLYSLDSNIIETEFKINSVIIDKNNNNIDGVIDYTFNGRNNNKLFPINLSTFN